MHIRHRTVAIDEAAGAVSGGWQRTEVVKLNPDKLLDEVRQGAHPLLTVKHLRQTGRSAHRHVAKEKDAQPETKCTRKLANRQIDVVIKQTPVCWFWEVEWSN